MDERVGADVLVSLNPSVFSFTTGSLLTGTISVLFQPWKLMASSESFVYKWLVGYSVVLGPIAGIMLTDYYVLRRSNLSVGGLYSSRADGPYYYTGGYNVSAFIALAAGMAPAIPGFFHKLGLIKITWKVFDVVYAGSWFFGFSFASLVYWVLTGAWRWVKCKAGKASTAESTMVEPLVRHTSPF